MGLRFFRRIKIAPGLRLNVVQTSGLGTLLGLLAAASCVVFSSPTMAEIYRCEVDGKVVYGDRPCQTGAKPVKIEANSVGEVDQSGLAAKRKALDKRINAKIELDADARDHERASRAAWLAQCDDYADQYQRQAAWLWSISDAARASAATEMQIQQRKWIEAGCNRPGSGATRLIPIAPNK